LAELTKKWCARTGNDGREGRDNPGNVVSVKKRALFFSPENPAARLLDTLLVH
jgi:hypothetical protein